MFCVQRNQMWINDGNWRRNWVSAFRASKENMELNGAYYKGVRDISSEGGFHETTHNFMQS